MDKDRSTGGAARVLALLLGIITGIIVLKECRSSESVTDRMQRENAIEAQHLDQLEREAAKL